VVSWKTPADQREQARKGPPSPPVRGRGAIEAGDLPLAPMKERYLALALAVSSLVSTSSSALLIP
jgi:hypothetical protein